MRIRGRSKSLSMVALALVVIGLALAGYVALDRSTDGEPAPAPRPVGQVTVLFLHGGAWVAGTSGEFEPLASKYRALGYNAISIEYRDGNNNILHLIDNVQAQVSKYKPLGPVVLYGSSAGGTLAAGVAATGKVDGAVVIGAPTDLVSVSANPYLGNAAKKILDALGMTRKELREASPISRLGRRPAKQLLHYGDRDLLVPLEQGTTYARAARKRQPETRIEILRGIDHSGSLVYTPRYADRALAWIRRHWPPPAVRR